MNKILILLLFILTGYVTTAVAQGSSMEFDGVDDRILLANKPNFYLPDAVTVEFWLNSDDWGGVRWRGIVSNRRNFGINVNASRLQWYYHDQSQFRNHSVSNSFVPIGSWVHFAGTIEQVGSGVVSNIYINGSLVSSITYANSDLSANIPETPVIGSTFNNASEPFDGKLDEVRIWNYARSQAEILSDMNEELNGTEGGLVAYYNFNNWLDPVQDLSGNGNTGTRLGSSGPFPMPQYCPVASPVNTPSVVPTVSEWGLIFLGLAILSMSGIILTRRKRKFVI